MQKALGRGGWGWVKGKSCQPEFNQNSSEVWAELPSLPCLPTKTFGMANLKGLDSERVRTRKLIEFGICTVSFPFFLRTSAKLFGIVSL